MAASAKPGVGEISTLTRAIEKIQRKLIRMLIGKMSLKKLQEMIQIIFIEETEAKLKKESPGKSVALGDIALQTGFDTRTIKKIRAHIANSKPIHQDNGFLDGFMPLFKVFDLWMNDANKEIQKQDSFLMYLKATLVFGAKLTLPVHVG